MKLPLGRSPEPDYLERYHKSWEHEGVDLYISSCRCS
jgi:hypothetical protein